MRKSMKKRLRKGNSSRKVVLMLMAVILCTVMMSCGKDKSNPMPESSQPQSSDTSSQSAEEIGELNPFTGESGFDEKLLTVRPMAAMINNIAVALPQAGIADADIIYEMEIEGAITRLLAVFSDYKSIKNIGSIRSARHDFVELVKPLNAIFLHYGGSDSGKQAIKSNEISAVDGLSLSNIAFYMDKERAKTKSTDHCWFSNGELIQAGIDKKQIETNTERLQPLFSFSLPEQDVMAEYAATKAASTVDATITSVVKAGFTYDSASKSYYKLQNGKPHIDSNGNVQLSFKNVFLMYTKVAYMANNLHREIDLSNGSGYYISNGKAIEVTFKKETIADKIKVYKTDGTELSVNAGKSYFAVISDSQREKLAIK